MEFNDIFTYYNEMFQSTDTDIFDNFNQFCTLDLGPINNWLEYRCKNTLVNSKNDKFSAEQRQLGNQFYKENNIVKSLELYTKSLCNATYHSKEYGLALANRSAVLFLMQDYENCLKDIEECFKSEYPISLRPKVYIRKAECFYELGETKSLNECISLCLDLIKTHKVENKEKFSQRLMALKEIKNIKSNNLKTHQLTIPTFNDRENTKFAYASSKLKLCYNKEKGRHVKAAEYIDIGDILFIEKAFIFAPVFLPEKKELNYFKCYNCLKDAISCIPCKNCSLCTFCNEKCRNSSWDEFHKWECVGMQGNIWYDLGIAFPALKCILKGMHTGLQEINVSYQDNTIHFGNKTNNYPYFRGLVSNIDKMENITTLLVMSAIVTIYLEKYTDFFKWYLKEVCCPKDNLKDLKSLVGGLISLHIAQLSNNSSIIEHQDRTFGETDPASSSVACGIFPSVSMMNHSCRPNISNFFIGDTVVVKALRSIEKDEEVCNCYGIDHRTMDREKRQKALASLYYFNCKCIICSDPNNEICCKNKEFSNYVCIKCLNIFHPSCIDRMKNVIIIESQKVICSTACEQIENPETINKDEMSKLEEEIKLINIQMNDKNTFIKKLQESNQDSEYKLEAKYIKQIDDQNLLLVELNKKFKDLEQINNVLKSELDVL